MDGVKRVSDIYERNDSVKSRKRDSGRKAAGRVILREGEDRITQDRREQETGADLQDREDGRTPCRDREDGGGPVRQDAADHALRMQGGRNPDTRHTGPYHNQGAGGRSAADRLGIYRDPKEEKQEGKGLVAQLQAQAEAMKDAFDPKKKKNLYDATMDLMLLEQAEKVPALKAMQSRLHFKIRAVKASGAKPGEIRRAVAKLKKVIAKVKAKVKNLKKEEELEKKRKKAEEARRKARERELRRELEMRKKVRKAKEKNDIEESKMGMGANYGGPGDMAAGPVPADVYTSVDGAAPPSGAVIDVAVADMGAAAETAVDVGV